MGKPAVIKVFSGNDKITPYFKLLKINALIVSKISRFKVKKLLERWIRKRGFIAGFFYFTGQKQNFGQIFCCLTILFSSLALQAQTTSSTAASRQNDGFRAGAAKSKITPPVGSIMGNSYGITVSEGVNDDLFAKALVFEKGGVRTAFIALDLISLPHEIVMRTRELIAERTDIPDTHIMMTATHVHAGPQLNPLFWGAVGGLPRQKSKEYAKELPAMIAESVQMAETRLQTVRVSVGTIQENAVNFNRRFLMKDGSFKMNPGRLNENSIRPVGPVDPELSVIQFESLDSKPVAFLVNFALHVAVVGGNHFSADFPGTLSTLLAKVHGEEVVTVFTNSTSGNINHVDVNRPDQLESYAESTRIGTILAADVLKALPSLRPIKINTLQVHTEAVELPVPSVQQKEVTWAHEVIGRFGKPEPPPFSEVVQAWRILDLAPLEGGIKARHRLTTTVPLTEDGGALRSEVQAITLGDELALVGFPGDAFVELGLSIKMNSPFPFTVVNEQSGNGTISYVPNRKAFPEGSYEVSSARFAPGGGEIWVDAAIRSLIELFPHK
ncbi:MAG: neutral/alkaline non-lysosomal ceramidase N-terminal domain-containing protein [Anditalea sp.]